MQAHSQRTILAGLLVCVTLLWGVAVADHQHLESHDHLCEICLLPQMAMAAPAMAAIPFAIPAAAVAEKTYQDIFPPLLPAYIARAPPSP